MSCARLHNIIIKDIEGIYLYEYEKHAFGRAY